MPFIEKCTELIKKNELVFFVLVILLIVIPTRLFIAQPFLVQGESMVPTFHDKEYLIVDQVSYRFSEPERGDVIIFRYPRHPETFYIKRIVGLPGERVKIDGGKVTIVQGSGVFALEEPYITNEDATYNSALTLKEGEYFVMGDNRPKSSDSRTWGVLPKENIIGRAWLRLLPFTEISLWPGAHTFTK